MCIPRVSNIYVGCFSQLSISRFGSRFTKKSYFGTLKMKKALFAGRNENWPSWPSFTSQGTQTCPIWPRSDKLCHPHGRILLIQPRSHATSNMIGHFREGTFW
jgi:hypothetical protein